MIESHCQVYTKSYITAQRDKNNNILKNKKMYDHVTPFLKRTNSSVSSCLLRDGLRDLIKNVSKIFLFFVYLGAF